MVKIFKFIANSRIGLARQLCTKKKEPPYSAESLKDRSVLLVTGKDSFTLLQRMMTNDLSKLNEPRNKSIFSVILNDKGKVLHDAIIYRYGDNYLLEVDSKALQPIKIHLKLHKGGREVDVKNLEDRLGVWAVMTHGDNELERLKEVDMGDYWITDIDPRLDLLGLRVIGPKRGDLVSILRNQGLPVARSQKNNYQMLRYKLGVAQGLGEIPLGRCSPTEINADYLSAICLKKTTYIGWQPSLFSSEFTRRVFPLEFPTDVEDTLPVNAPIQDERGVKKSPIGYLRGIKKNFGLGLVSVSEVMKNTQVRVCSKQRHFFVSCNRPSWWPLDPEPPAPVIP